MSQGEINLKFDPQTKISLQRYTRNDHTAFPVQVGNIRILLVYFSCLIRLLIPTESNNN